ncbi:hypothetical protein M8494_12310 [Serratia ureilytica]
MAKKAHKEGLTLKSRRWKLATRPSAVWTSGCGRKRWSASMQK